MSKNASDARKVMDEVITSVVEGLRWKARALRTIGLSELEGYAAALEPLPKEMFDAIGRDLDRDLAASQEMSGGMLKLILGGHIQPDRRRD